MPDRPFLIIGEPSNAVGLREAIARMCRDVPKVIHLDTPADLDAEMRRLRDPEAHTLAMLREARGDVSVTAMLDKIAGGLDLSAYDPPRAPNRAMRRAKMRRER